MKKTLAVFVVVMMIFCLSISFAGCKGNHNYECEHIYDSGTITYVGTCDSARKITYRCEKCGKSYSDTLPMNDRLKQVFEWYCSSPWATHGSDWSYIKIDTYPSSASSKYTYVIKATDAIESINNALNIPEYVKEQMLQTTAIDGRQTISFETLTVTWVFLDQGLKVMYQILSNN